MTTLANVGGTLTGGTSVVLTNAGNPTGTRAVFYTPAHTRLAAREVDLTVQQAKTTDSDAGVARAGAKILLANRDPVSGCCSVQAGSVIIDINARWSLNQPATLVDEALELALSVIKSAEFANAIKLGILP